MLTLPIKKKWFDMILSGEKREEYREIKPYYQSRFDDLVGGYCEFKVMFRNGYSKKSPSFIATCTVTVDYGFPLWGADPNTLYYVLQIHEIEEVHDEH